MKSAKTTARFSRYSYPCRCFCLSCDAARADKAVAAAASETSDARVTAAKHLLDQAVASRVEHAALRQAFSSKIRSYDEQTSLQVRDGRYNNGTVCTRVCCGWPNRLHLRGAGGGRVVSKCHG